MMRYKVGDRVIVKNASYLHKLETKDFITFQAKKGACYTFSRPYLIGLAGKELTICKLFNDEILIECEGRLRLPAPIIDKVIY